MSCINCGFKENIIQKQGANFISEETSSGCNKLETFDWLGDVPNAPNIVEVRFKNTRKEYFINSEQLMLEKNMLVAVESSAGHDIGFVSLTGHLAELNLKRKVQNYSLENLKRIYRIATNNDTQQWKEAKSLEDPTMLTARQIANSLGLEMKISDVEFQGDKKKATFYYIADQRVDFRELIKEFASSFKVKIEMKQIGVRQEAGRIGGIGSCGRELCCSTWRTELPSISQLAVIQQNLPPNSEKYLGQCGKLKCCLTYELDSYIEAKQDFPKELLALETKFGVANPIKIDILKKLVWYNLKIGSLENHIAVHIDKVKEYMMLNKKGKILEKLE